MNNKPEPNWYPIKNMPMIASLIDGQLADLKDQYASLLEARPKPHVLTDAIVQRVTRVYTEQFDFAWVFEEQLSKWEKEERLAPTQQKEIKRLQVQVQEIRKFLVDILALAEELKMGTIEKVMAKSDFELGMEYFKRKESET